jgi:hypothetical protein
MSKTVLASFAACVGLSLLSPHLVKQMRAGQATIAELQAQVAKLESERQNNPPSPAPTATWQVEPVTPPAATPTKEAVAGMTMKRSRAADDVAASPPSREERMRMVREARDRQRELLQDPEYREALRLQQRSLMGRSHPNVAQELGITAEQAEQLFDLLADQQMRNNEQPELLWDAEELDPATLQQRQEKMQQRWAEIQKTNDAELAALLGPDKLQAWKEYQSTLGSRHQAEQLRSTLASRGVPINDEANRAVVKAYAEAQKAEMQEYANMAARASAPSSSAKAGLVRIHSSGSTAEMYERQMEYTKKRNQRVLEALSPFLTYEQREALQKEQEAELKMQEAQMRIMRAQSNVDGASNTDWVGNSVQSFIVPSQ